MRHDGQWSRPGEPGRQAPAPIPYLPAPLRWQRPAPVPHSSSAKDSRTWTSARRAPASAPTAFAAPCSLLIFVLLVPRSMPTGCDRRTATRAGYREPASSSTLDQAAGGSLCAAGPPRLGRPKSRLPTGYRARVAAGLRPGGCGAVLGVWGAGSGRRVVLPLGRPRPGEVVHRNVNGLQALSSSDQMSMSRCWRKSRCRQRTGRTRSFPRRVSGNVMRHIPQQELWLRARWLPPLSHRLVAAQGASHGQHRGSRVASVRTSGLAGLVCRSE